MSESELITSWNALEPLANQWDALWRVSETCREEFCAFEWTRAVAVKASRGRGHPWCVLVRSGNDIEEIAPLYCRKTTMTRLRIPMNVASFFPSHLLFRHGFLTARGPDSLTERVVQQLEADRRVDAVILLGLPKPLADGVFDSATAHNARCSILQINRARGNVPGTASGDLCAIALPSSWETYLRSRTRRFRKQLKRAERRATALGAVEFWRQSGGKQILGESKTVPEIAGWIRAVEQNSWQGRKGVHLGRYGYGHVEELVSIAQRAGVLDVSFLLLDGRPIAYDFGWAIGTRGRSCCTGYREAFAEISPGILLKARLIRSSIDDTPLERIDLGGSRHYHKRQLADLRDSAYEVTLYGSTMKGKLLYYYRRHLGKWHHFA